MNLILDAFRVSVISILLLLLFKFVLSINLKAINTFQALSSKISYSDLYYSKFYSNDKKDATIALVNIGEASRKEIILSIAQICNSSNASIGVDISFSKKSTPVLDSLLVATLDSCKNITLPIYGNQWISNQLKDKANVKFGNNALIADKNGVVKFVPINTPTEHHFVEQLIGQNMKSDDPKAKLKEINFFGNYKNFQHYELEEINTAPLDKVKYILIGYAGSTWESKLYAEDHHYTPLDVNNNRLEPAPTPGLVIHANVLRNALLDDFVDYAAIHYNYLILFILLFISNIFYLGNFRRLSVSFYLKCRVYQILMTSLLAYIIFLLFHHYQLKFGLAEWIIAIIASFELSVLYAYIMNDLGNKFGIKSYIHNRIQSV